MTRTAANARFAGALLVIVAGALLGLSAPHIDGRTLVAVVSVLAGLFWALRIKAATQLAPQEDHHR